MRIVFLNPSGQLGGAETALLELLAALRAARPSWSLSLVSSAPGPLIDRASILGVSAVALPFPASLARLGEWGRRDSPAGRLHLLSALTRAACPTFAYALRLRRYLRSIQPDLVHTNGFKMHILGAWCRPAGARILWHLHDYPQPRPLTTALLRASASRCAAIVTNSQSVADQARRLFRGVAPVRAIYNAVDLDRFTPSGPRLDLDALAGVPPLAADGVRVGLVGTFARWKGHGIFLEALTKVTTPFPVRGYIIGDSIYETAASQFSLAELREMAARFHLGDRIAFTGRVSDVPSALRSLDIVVHASVEPEPFGLVIAEAMACGRPVIVSRAGGAAEIAQAGVVFHRPGEAVELAARITELALDDRQRLALGAAARQAAVRLFSRARVADALVPLYEALR